MNIQLTFKLYFLNLISSTNLFKFSIFFYPNKILMCIFNHIFTFFQKQNNVDNKNNHVNSIAKLPSQETVLPSNNIPKSETTPHLIENHIGVTMNGHAPSEVTRLPVQNGLTTPTSEPDETESPLEVNYRN